MNCRFASTTETLKFLTLVMTVEGLPPLILWHMVQPQNDDGTFLLYQKIPVSVFYFLANSCFTFSTYPGKWSGDQYSLKENGLVTFSLS